jgi:hypothetical protein
VTERRDEGLLVRTGHLGVAEEICRRLVNRVWAVDGFVELNADLAWAGAINIVLVKKGVTVNEFAFPEETSKAQEARN